MFPEFLELDPKAFPMESNCLTCTYVLQDFLLFHLGFMFQILLKDLVIQDDLTRPESKVFFSHQTVV